MSLGHLYVLFGEVSVQALCPFLIGWFVFLVLSFVSSLYILDINPLSDVFTNMFSHSVGYCLILLMFSFAVQKLLVSCSPICLLFLLFPLPGKIYLIKYCYEQCPRFYRLCFLLGFL